MLLLKIIIFLMGVVTLGSTRTVKQFPSRFQCRRLGIRIGTALDVHAQDRDNEQTRQADSRFSEDNLVFDEN
jgi:hypothetical protein